MSDDSKTNDTTTENAPDKPFVRYDDYWLQKGREMIDGSLEALSERLKSLNNFLNYLAGGSFIGGVALTTYLQSSKLGVYWLVVIPLIFIAIAKFAIGVKGTELVIRDTDMRNPSQINVSYGQILKKLSEQIKWAAGWVAAATAFTLVCIPIAIYFHNCDKNIEPPKSYLNIEKNENKLILQGVLPNTQSIGLILYGEDSKKKGRKSIFTHLSLPKSGILQDTIDLTENTISLDSLDFHYLSDKMKRTDTYRFKKQNSKAPAVKTK